MQYKCKTRELLDSDKGSLHKTKRKIMVFYQTGGGGLLGSFANLS